MEQGPQPKVYYTQQEYDALPEDKRAKITRSTLSSSLFYDKKALKELNDNTMWSFGGMKDDLNDCIAAFSIKVKVDNGSGGGPRTAKDLKELGSALTSFHGFNHQHPPQSITIIEKKPFTEEAKQKTREVILNYLATNFSLVKLKITGDILDEESSNKINSYLKRNQRLSPNYKKIHTTFYSYAAGLILGSLLSFSLPVLAMNAMFLLFMRWLLRKDFNQVMTKNTVFIGLILNVAVLTGLLIPAGAGEAAAAILGITTAIIGTIAEHVRKKYFVQNAFKKYADDNVVLNETEKESFKIGLEAQKGFTPSYYFSKTAWASSSASYLGAYCPENILPKPFNEVRVSSKL